MVMFLYNIQNVENDVSVDYVHLFFVLIKNHQHRATLLLSSSILLLLSVGTISFGPPIPFDPGKITTSASMNDVRFFDLV